MRIEKLRSENVGEHHPRKALILTDKGEIYVTRNRRTSKGYALHKFFDPAALLAQFDAQAINTAINAMLRGQGINGGATASLVDGKIAVSPIANMFTVSNYQPFDVLLDIEGGREGQCLTVLGDGTPLTILPSERLKLIAPMTLQSRFDVLMLQHGNGVWKEVTRSTNG